MATTHATMSILGVRAHSRMSRTSPPRAATVPASAARSDIDIATYGA